MTLPAYRVSAFNTSKVSENKIHDDAAARRFGFRGGFVSGANVYAYMSHQPVQRWGRAWLDRGTLEAKFAKPVYENDIAEVAAVEEPDGLALTVHSRDILCATGRAAMLTRPLQAPALGDFKSVAPRNNRVPADESSLKVNDWLGMTPITVTEELHTQDLHDLRETDPIYAREKIVHPGTILRCCNWALSHNVILPAWIHMGSVVQNLGVASVGETLSVRARITKNYEHKGHKWVELDSLVVANEATPVIRATHVAIYRPRQLDEAA